MGKAKGKKAPKKAVRRERSAKEASIDPREAFLRFRAEAEALPEDAVKVARMSAPVVRAVAARTQAALAPYLAQIHKLAPAVDAAKVASVSALAHAFEYAVDAVPLRRSDQSIKAALARVTPLRRAALAFLEAASYCGIVSAGRVRAIRTGRGKLDVARDAIAIEGLFAEEARALAGKHPFTAAQLATLRDDGEWLLERLTPAGAIRPRERAPEALLRDRIATLLLRAYAEAEKLAVVVWGAAEFRAHVPKLRTHR